MKMMDWKASCAPSAGVGLWINCGEPCNSWLVLHDISNQLEMVFFLKLILILPYSLTDNSKNSILIPDE